MHTGTNNKIRGVISTRNSRKQQNRLKAHG